MQVGDNDQYIVRVDGSRRLTLRNRRFLRKMQPISPDAYYLHRQAPPHTKSSTQIPHSPTEIVPQLPLTQSPMKQLESPNLVRAISPPKQKDTPALLPALPQTEAQRHDPAFDLPSYAPEIHDQGQEVQSPLSPLKQQVRPAPGRPRKKISLRNLPLSWVPLYSLQHSNQINHHHNSWCHHHQRCCLLNNCLF